MAAWKAPKVLTSLLRESRREEWIKYMIKMPQWCLVGAFVQLLFKTWVVKKSLISLWWKWHIFSKHQWWYWHETAKHHLNITRHHPGEDMISDCVKPAQPFLGSPATVLQSKLFTADLREVNVLSICFTSTNNAWHGQRWTQFCVHMFQQTYKVIRFSRFSSKMWRLPKLVMDDHSSTETLWRLGDPPRH